MKYRLFFLTQDNTCSRLKAFWGSSKNMFSNQHLILCFTSGDERHTTHRNTTGSIFKASNWEPGGRSQTYECSCLLPKPPPGGHSQSTDIQGPCLSASTGHRWGTLLSPSTLTVPPDPQRAVSSKEGLGGRTHLCPSHSMTLCPFLSRYWYHTVISPMASAQGQVRL